MLVGWRRKITKDKSFLASQNGHYPLKQNVVTCATAAARYRKGRKQHTLIQIFHSEKGKLRELEGLERGCWINIYPPYTRQELDNVSAQLDIPIDYVDDSLDFDERPRYEQENGVQLIIVNTPIPNDGIDDSDALYTTIPIGIIEVDHYVLTISKYKNPVIDHFLDGQSKSLDTSDHSEFVLLMFERTIFNYLHFLKMLNYQRNLYEKELYNSSRNSELSKMLNIQKSLVYFVTTLRTNELLFMKIKRTDFIKIRDDEDKQDFLEDIIVDTGQALEMSNIYSNILNGTMDAFASIISNNLNIVMRRLTAVTIVLMVPTLVASFYGTNLALPFAESNYAFLLIIIVSIVCSGLLVGVFRKLNWL